MLSCLQRIKTVQHPWSVKLAGSLRRRICKARETLSGKSGDLPQIVITSCTPREAKSSSEQNWSTRWAAIGAQCACAAEVRARSRGLQGRGRGAAGYPLRGRRPIPPSLRGGPGPGWRMPVSGRTERREAAARGAGGPGQPESGRAPRGEAGQPGLGRG